MKEIKDCFKILAVIPDEYIKVRQTDNIVIPFNEENMLATCNEIAMALADVARRLMALVHTESAATCVKGMYSIIAKIYHILANSIVKSSSESWYHEDDLIIKDLKDLFNSDEFKEISTIYNGGVQEQIDKGAGDWQTFNIFCFLSVDMFGEDDDHE